jgi:serine/threonine protein kinase
MGVVYKAEHRLMHRNVALKVMNDRLVGSPLALDRFRHEVRAAARLVHPNIVLAYDAEQAGAIHFLVMEYVEGTSLDRLLVQRGPLPVAEACDLVRQAAIGLHKAHEEGMVHRDIKPGNLIVTPSGQVKVLDFGLSRFLSETVRPDALTASGVVVGTPDYMAPEQANDPRTADIRADIYSLGCTLYHLIAGRPPFIHGTVVQKLIAHREKPVPPLGALVADLPAGLGSVVERMLAKSPDSRFQTPALVAAALAPFCPSGAVPVVATAQRKQRLAVAGLLAGGCLLAAVGVLSLVSSPPLPPTHALKPTEEITPTIDPVRLLPATAPEPTKAVPPSEPLATKKQPLARVTVSAVMPKFHKSGVTELTRREEMIAWYKDNCPEGAESAEAAAWAERLLTGTRPKHDLHLVLGPSLVRSRKITFLTSFGDGLFAFELAPADAAPMYVGDKQIKVNVKGHEEARLNNFECSDLKLTDIAGEQEGVEITIRTKYIRRQPTDGHLCMRVYKFPFDGPDFLLYVPLKPLKPDEGDLQFRFKWPDPVRSMQPTPPLLYFFELCTTTEPGKYKDVKVVGNTQAALFRARWDKPEPAPVAP